MSNIQKPKILIADDQADVLKALRLLLNANGYEIETASGVVEVIQAVDNHDFDVVLIDLNYVRGETSGKQGLDLLTRIRQADDLLPVIVMTAWSSVELAVETMRRGARDFVPKPWKNEHLLTILKTQIDLARALRESKRLSQEIDCLKDSNRRGFIAESPVMRPILETISQIAPSDANVLITGENGSGKGIVAQAIHEASHRKNKPLLMINTAGIPESVFESELFGHVAGAFTDAKTDRLGRFRLADEGTLFMDEIATIPVNLQAKLLRVLESGEFELVGSSKTCHVNVRVLSATNANLDEEIETGRFRRDLLYRLNTIHIRIPPLRRRPEDIPLLASHFLQRYITKYRKRITGFNDSSMQMLLSYHWPGNVRQLDHTIERAVLMARTESICLGDLGLEQTEDVALGSKNMTLEQIERVAICEALNRCDSDISKTAQSLGLSRAALYRRLEKYQIG
jgi:DNA-binding NtrC family response regulator